MQETAVLISGAGPAGLILSIDLSRRGIDHILLNDRPGPSGLPKLDIANTRTMEILRSLGVVDQVRAAGLPTHRPTRVTFKSALCGQPILSLEPGFDATPLVPYSSVDEFNENIRNYNDGTLPLETNAIVSQMYLEPALKSHAEQQARADVRFDHAFLDFQEHQNGVTATVRNNNKQRDYNIKADYLVACDGAQSLIREKLGIGLDGAENIGEMTSFFLQSEDISNADPLGPPWHCWSINPELAGVTVSLNLEKHYFNIHVFGRHEAADKTLQSMFGRPFDYTLFKQTHWFVNLLVAQNYSSARVFLAGDSAHQYFPTYGFGYNTAVLDVINLGWKLAATVQGWGGPGLLKSYQREQSELGKTRRDYSGMGAQMTQAWHSSSTPEVMQDDELGEQHRKALAERIALSHPRLYDSLGLELGYRYGNSTVVVSDGTPEPPSEEKKYLPTTWPGSRLPHVFLADGSAIFDRLGLDFTLIVNGAKDRHALKTFTTAALESMLPLEILHIDEPWISALFERKYLLVRPDQHVAWRADSIPDNCTEVLNQVAGKM